MEDLGKIFYSYIELMWILCSLKLTCKLYSKIMVEVKYHIYVLKKNIYNTFLLFWEDEQQLAQALKF